MRGKKLSEVLTADEIRKKTAEHEPYGIAPPPEHTHPIPQPIPQVQIQPLQPHQQVSGFVAKISSLRSRIAKYVKRAAILAVFIAFVLVVHSLDPVRVRVASLLGTTSGSPLVQSTSTAIPFAVVVAVVVAWFMEAG